MKKNFDYADLVAAMQYGSAAERGDTDALDTVGDLYPDVFKACAICMLVAYKKPISKDDADLAEKIFTQIGQRTGKQFKFVREFVDKDLKELLA